MQNIANGAYVRSATPDNPWYKQGSTDKYAAEQQIYTDAKEKELLVSLRKRSAKPTF